MLQNSSSCCALLTRIRSSVQLLCTQAVDLHPFHNNVLHTVVDDGLTQMNTLTGSLVPPMPKFLLALCRVKHT